MQGTVSLASGRPVPKGDLLFVLESALRLSSAALVRDRRGYRHRCRRPKRSAPARIDLAARAEPGFGITVVPLQYVSAATLDQAARQFRREARHRCASMPTRNLVLVQGTGADRRNATETVLSFDADWMRGQSVGIYPVRNSDARAGHQPSSSASWIRAKAA